jgi:hypothetical protein
MFSAAQNDTGGGSLFAGNTPGSQGTSYNVPAITLQEVFDTLGLDKLDFMKVDCEGGEYEMFYSVPSQYMTRISQMVVEYHTHTHPNWREEKNNLVNFLSKNGFDVQESDCYALLYASRA